MTSKDIQEVFRIPPNHYVHILDQNTNVTRIEVGPRTYICQDHEMVVYGPQQMIIIPPQHFCIIQNPCLRKLAVTDDSKSSSNVCFDEYGQVQLKHGRLEIRLKEHMPNPFPLYPGEVLKTEPAALQIIAENSALHLLCLEDFVDENNIQRYAGQEWLYPGPCLYIPNVNVHELGMKEAKIIKRNQALRLVATQNCTDGNGIKRIIGEEWLIIKEGAYMCGVYEKMVNIVDAIALTDVKACHIRCIHTFVDELFDCKREPGDEWLISVDNTATYIPSVNEQQVKDVPLTILNSRQYCVICDPFNVETNNNELGKYRLLKGPSTFFLHPRERLRDGVQNVYILEDDDGLILTANQAFKVETSDDEKSDVRTCVAGEKWMIRGPKEYIPRVEVNVIRSVKALALAKDEGVYIRDIRNGTVRSIIGQNYMLNEYEELWEKEIPSVIEKLIYKTGSIADGDDRKEMKMNINEKIRDKTHVVKYVVPHNCACQIYDYQTEKPRVVFGPNLVILGADEMFTPLCLSGGKPKKAGQIRAIHLQLGPDFFTDILEVETSDHARLSIRLSYNWSYDLSKIHIPGISDDIKYDEEHASSTKLPVTALFYVPDFVGDACNHLASRVRAAVACSAFDDFHKNSSRIIRASIFGKDGDGNLGKEFMFAKNALVINEVDIQEIVPVNEETRLALQHSVQLAIGITTSSQEAAARHSSDVQQQQSVGKLQQQVIRDDCQNEKSRKVFYEIKAETEAIKIAGSAIANAESAAESDRILYEAKIDEAKFLEEAANILLNEDLVILNNERKEELLYLTLKNSLTADYYEQMSNLKTVAFQRKIDAIGRKTIGALALCNAQSKLDLMSSLNLKTTLVMDTKHPMNLFDISEKIIATKKVRRGGRRYIDDDRKDSEVEDDDDEYV